MLTLFALAAVTKFSGSDGSNPLKITAQGSSNRRASVKLKQSENTFKL